MLSHGTPKLTESWVRITDAGRTPRSRIPRFDSDREDTPSRQEGHRGHTHTHNRGGLWSESRVNRLARRPQAEGVHNHPASPLSAWSSSAGNSLLLVSCRYCLSRKGGDHRDGTAMELYVHQRRHFNYLDEHQAKPALQRWR